VTQSEIPNYNWVSAHPKSCLVVRPEQVVRSINNQVIRYRKKGEENGLERFLGETRFKG